jgi:hypothetical protein
VFGLLAATFEITVALLMLSNGRYAKIGLIAGSLFLLAITPLGFDTFPNALFALGLAYLATKDYEASLWAMIAGKLHSHRPTDAIKE